MEIKFNHETGNWEALPINSIYTGKYGWVFKNLDTPPFYNCYVSENTYKKIKHKLTGEYKCNIENSLDTLKGEKGYLLCLKAYTKKI